jgi:hypothetical protein
VNTLPKVQEVINSLEIGRTYRWAEILTIGRGMGVELDRKKHLTSFLRAGKLEQSKDERGNNVYTRAKEEAP